MNNAVSSFPGFDSIQANSSITEKQVDRQILIQQEFQGAHRGAPFEKIKIHNKDKSKNPAQNAAIKKIKKLQQKTIEEKKAHSKNMAFKRVVREALNPNKRTERLRKAKINTKKWRQKKKMEDKERDIILKSSILNKELTDTNIEAMKGLSKVQELQDKQAKKNSDEKTRLTKERKQLNDDLEELKRREKLIELREKEVKIREVKVEMKENLIIRKD